MARATRTATKTATTRKAAAKAADVDLTDEQGTDAPEAPAKPKRAQKAPVLRKRGIGSNVKITEVQMVSVDDLHPHPKNPRRGNVTEVAKSFHVNGQMKPIVVNRGSKTGRPNEILAGHHMWRGAKERVQWQQDGRTMIKEPWDEVLVGWVDLTDDEATRYLLADNKTAEDGTYDDSLLAELMAGLPDTVGTGFTSDEVDSMIAALNVDIAKDATTLDDLRAAMPERIEPEQDNSVTRPKKGSRAADLEEQDEDQQDAATRRGVVTTKAEDDESDLDAVDVTAEMQYILQQNESELYGGDNPWEIPDLRPDMLLEELPDDVQTWGGSEATPDDGAKTFFYNFSLGSRKTMPYDRTIMMFNTYDNKFSQWFAQPAWHVAKFSVLGINRAVVPDFSFYYNDVRVSHLWNVYKAQWLGRFMQEAGWKIIPRIQFDYTDPGSLSFAALGIPDDPPLLMHSAQNMEDGEHTDEWKGHMKDALEQINPKKLILYSGNPGRKAFQQIKTSWSGEVVFLMNYAGVRRGKAYDKAEGIKKAAKRKAGTKINKTRQMVREVGDEDEGYDGDDD